MDMSNPTMPYAHTCNYVCNIICNHDENIIIDHAITDMNRGLNHVFVDLSYCDSRTLSTLFKT